MRGGHTWPLLLLGVLVCAYFVPQLATGTVQFDGVDVHYSSQRYFSDAVRAGHLPFWTPYLFAGFPFLADLQTGAWYPLNWPFFLVGITASSMTGELLLHSLIASAGAYALAVRMTGQPSAGVTAGVFYALSGWFAAHSQHVGMFETAAWLPWLLLVLRSLARRLTLARLGVAGLIGAVLALPGHFQVALYAFSGAALLALAEAALARSSRRIARVAIGLGAVAGWGALLSAVMILPAFELVGLSQRAQLNAREVDLGYFQLDSLLTLVQPDHFGLLSGKYEGPGDVTQHYFYAGILLVPLALVGLRNLHVAATALLVSLPFLWYALGPDAGLFRVVARLPGFRSVELPMHGWFLPALGLALLGGAGLLVVPARLRIPLVVVLFVDVLVFNQLQNPLAYARQSFDELYGAPLRALQAQVQVARPAVQRVYGPPLTAVGYRNHALQSRVETTYGYNPLELIAYSDYADAAETNPHLVDGMAATRRLIDGATLQSNPGALPLAYFARTITSVPDQTTATERLSDLDPASETLVLGSLPGTNFDPTATATVVERGDDYLVVHYRATSSNLLRVAIPWFPGWHAALDAKELAVMTVDRAFIGVVLPPGEGDIRLWYSPRFFVAGAAISALALLGTIAALLLGRGTIAQSERSYQSRYS